jgi:hypothetical protein
MVKRASFLLCSFISTFKEISALLLPIILKRERRVVLWGAKIKVARNSIWAYENNRIVSTIILKLTGLRMLDINESYKLEGESNHMVKLP